MFDEILQWFSSHLSNLTDALVYCAIAGVTLIGVFKCLIPLITTTHALRRAITRLQQDAGTRQGTPVWQEKRFMGNRLKNCWLRFLQNAEQLDRRGLPCNVEDYINDDTVIHGPGNAQLADLIPGLLTSLGILGTFMGMMDGLGGLDFSNADKIIEGIPTLLTGMQFAFGTSVAGVSCSICFNIINRILQGSSYRAIDDFVSNFTSLAMSRPLDNDVQLICQNQDSNHMLSTLTDTLPGQLAGAMEHSVRSAMQPVSQAMDNFLMGATRAQVDGVGRIVGSFVQQMNASLSDQLLTLGRTMTEVNQHQQASLEQVRQSLNAAAAIQVDMRQLHDVTNDVIAHFEQYIKELSAARSRDEGFERSSADLLTRLGKVSDQQLSALNRIRAGQEELARVTEQFTRQSSETTAAMKQSSNATTQELSGVADAMKQSAAELSAGCQNFTQSVVSGLSQSLGMFDASMQGLMAMMGETTDKLSGTDSAEATRQAAETQRLLTALKESIDAATAALRQSLRKSHRMDHRHRKIYFYVFVYTFFLFCRRYILIY